MMILSSPVLKIGVLIVVSIVAACLIYLAVDFFIQYRKDKTKDNKWVSLQL